MTQCLIRRLLLSLFVFVGGPSLRAQFIALNDHFQGPNSHTNATFWNVFDTSGGAPGSSGPLKNISTGANLPVVLTITNNGARGGTTSGAPATGTPAEITFRGYIDWGSGTLNHAIQIDPGVTVSHVLTGLDTNKKYSLKATGVRGGGYANRWTIFDLTGASAFRSAHTSGCLTNGTPGITSGAISSSQAVINTGQNDATGDMADWEDIEPGSDGTIAILASKYSGPVPNGASDGSYGYGLTALRLEEFNTALSAAVIVSEPQDQTVVEGEPVQFKVGAAGNPAPTIQWYKDGSAILNATNTSYTIAAAPLSENGALLKVIAQNTTNGVHHSATSIVARLTVLADTNPPVLLGATALGLNQVQARFSERLAPSTATNAANYVIRDEAGNPLQLFQAALDNTQSSVVLTVSPLTEGMPYTLTVSGVTDLAAAANPIATGSQASFMAAAYTPQNIGNPAMPGSIKPQAGGYDILAGGSGIGGNSDQCFLAYQTRNGDFDMKVRLLDITLTDVWAEAGLMAREAADANSRFAAALATPSLAGIFFEARATAGQAAQKIGGVSPINYPSTWLRLKRAGNLFSGFSSFDGKNWTPLGSVTMTLPATLEVGTVASSHNPTQTVTARLREVGDVVDGLTHVITRPIEPLGPSTRKTPFAITEIMYKPAPRRDGKQLEFMEIFNSNPFPEEIGQYRLTGEIQYQFPTNTVIPGGGFLVLAKVPADVESYYGISGVLGYGVPTYTTNLAGGLTLIQTNILNSLNGKGGVVNLVNSCGGVVLEIPYSSEPPWPAGAHGTGHSLVLARPSHGEGDPHAWGISDSVDGSPGRPDPYTPDPRRQVVINEFLANSHDPDVPDFIELYNHSNEAVDLAGCVLTDDPATNKFMAPAGTVVPPRGFVFFDRTQLGFGLNSAGETLYFISPDGAKIFDVVQYEPQAAGVSSGRYPDGAADFFPRQARTPGAANSEIRASEVVINEIMYAPITRNNDDQYVELFNPGEGALDLTGWRFSAGKDAMVLDHGRLEPGGFLVIARNATNLMAKYSNLKPQNTIGNFPGKLKGSGERIALARPEALISTNSHLEVTTNIAYVVVDEVTYRSGGQWPHWAAHGGSSLELIDPRSNHRLPSNWADSDETAKAPWTTIQATGPMDNSGATANAVEGGLLEEGECLVDDIEVIAAANPTNLVANPGFETGSNTWAFRGTHIRSSVESNSGINGGAGLHVRASSRCDYGPNRIYAKLKSNPSGTVTLRAKVRWLKGWPEFLLRLHGNAMEATGPLTLPQNLGTPGMPNSRKSVAGPAIYVVRTSPILPSANEPVIITARVHAPYGLASISLNYRIDPAKNFVSVPMRDDGMGGDEMAGDGIYSATIPGQPANTLAAFVIRTQGQGVPAVTGLYPGNTPDNAILRECLIRFGEPNPPSTFGTYRQWFTKETIDAWVNRPYLSNEMLEGTFVYGDYRVIYNFGARIAGSPWHQGGPGTAPAPTSDLHYNLAMPPDDLLLGADNFNKLHAPGNGAFDDATLQREQTGYWIARQLGLPWSYRRFVNCYVNGNRRRANALMEDMQVPGPDLVAEYFPQGANGHLYKNQCWFEMDDGQAGGMPNSGNASWCSLNKYTTTVNGVPGQFKLARYRWNWFMRAAKTSANDYADVFALIDAANPPAGPLLTERLQNAADIQEWMRVWAVRHSLGDWDFFGAQNAQNSYAYKPDWGKWQLFIFDMNIVLGNSGSWGPGQNLFTVNTSQPGDPVMARIYSHPPFRRMYLRALKEICLGPMVSAKIDPIMDAKYQAFLADGVLAGSPASLKSWIVSARASILSTVRAEDATAFTVNTPASLDTTNSPMIITGQAPVEVASITINGMEYPATWTSVKNWSIQAPLRPGSNVLVIRGIDLSGQPIASAASNLTVRYGGPDRIFSGVAINEWMASNLDAVIDPADGKAEDWFELYNGATQSIDLTDCWLSRSLTNRSEFRIPSGCSIPAGGHLLVWADNEPEQYGASISNLHVNFRLSKEGSSVGLFTPEGQIIDFIAFGPQTPNISQGRYPDGAGTFYFMNQPTPQSSNRFDLAPQTPVFDPIPTQTAFTDQTFGYVAHALAEEALVYRLDDHAPAGASMNSATGEFVWTPGLNLAASTNAFAIYAGNTAQPSNQAGAMMTLILRPPLRIESAHLENGQLRLVWHGQAGVWYRVVFKNDLLDPDWQNVGDPIQGTGELNAANVEISSNPQGFYRLLEVDAP